jgi:hypothetical protein
MGIQPNPKISAHVTPFVHNRAASYLAAGRSCHSDRKRGKRQQWQQDHVDCVK